VAGGWRRPHNEELHNLYTIPSIIRLIKSGWWKGGACFAHGRNKKYIQNFGWKTWREENAW